MKILKAFSLFAVLICISGCALIIGTSVTALEKEKVRYTKVFDKDVSYCYAKTLEALKKWEADVFLRRDKQYVVAVKLDKVFNSCIDTTEAGIFFKELEPNKTQVDVSSLNYQLGAFVADNLFRYIEHPEAPTCPILHEKPIRFK